MLRAGDGPRPGGHPSGLGFRSLSDTIPGRIGHRSDSCRTPSNDAGKLSDLSPETLSDMNRNGVRQKSEPEYARDFRASCSRLINRVFQQNLQYSYSYEQTDFIFLLSQSAPLNLCPSRKAGRIGVSLTARRRRVTMGQMKRTNALPAPRIEPLPAAEDKWGRERRAFHRLRPSLLRSHLGKYVAVHQCKVVDSGDDQIAVALRVYKRFGYLPIYVGQVLAEPPLPVRMPSPRSIRLLKS
jgi:hypothetical protein